MMATRAAAGMAAPAPPVLDPIDYGAFRFTAAIDWIEVRVKLARPTQPHQVRARIAKLLPGWVLPFVTAETAHSSRTSRSIVFRVQDPPGVETFMREVQLVAQPGSPRISESDVEIMAVELALDAEHRDHERAELVRMAHHFQSRHARPPPGPTRVTGPDGYGEIVATPARVRRALELGWTLNVGQIRAGYQARYYVKDHNTEGGSSYAQLSPERWRARMEVTRSGEEVPFTTIDGWRNFKFETYTHLLTLRSVIMALTADGRQMQSATLKHGAPRDELKSTAHRKTTKGKTKADLEAYEITRNALRALTRAQRGRTPRSSQTAPHAPGWGDWA